MFSTVINYKHSYPALLLVKTTETPEVYFFQSFRTKKNFFLFTNCSLVDRDQTVSRRSEPKSGCSLIDEQSNPWKQLHLQDEHIRHRGTKHLNQ